MNIRPFAQRLPNKFTCTFLKTFFCEENKIKLFPYYLYLIVLLNNEFENRIKRLLLQIRKRPRPTRMGKKSSGQIERNFGKR